MKQNSNFQLLTEDEKARLRKLAPEELNKEMQVKIQHIVNEVEKTQEHISALTEYNFINTERLTNIMVDADNWFIVRVFVYVVAIITMAGFVPVNGDISAALNEIIMGTATIIIMIMVGFFAFFIEKTIKSSRAKWAQKNMHKAYFFESQCIKVGRRLAWHKYRIWDYHIRFKDDKGRTRRADIPEEEYERLKALPYSLERIYVLCFPKKGLSKGYKPFDKNALENQSNIPFKSYA